MAQTATEKQIAYLTALAQRVFKGAETEQMRVDAKYVIDHCKSFSKDKAGLLIGDFKYLIRSINFARTLRCERQI